MRRIRCACDQRQDRPDTRGERLPVGAALIRIPPPDRAGDAREIGKLRGGECALHPNADPAERLDHRHLRAHRLLARPHAQERRTGARREAVQFPRRPRQQRLLDQRGRGLCRADPRREHRRIGLSGPCERGFRFRRRPRAHPCDVMRAARFWSGARKPLTAEGLAADHRADLVAVYVSIARMDRLEHLLHAAINPRVEAEGQAESGCVDRGDHLLHLAGFERGDMQHRAEDLALEIGDPVHADHHGGDEMALAWRLQLVDHAALRARLCDIIGDIALSFCVNHRADIGGEIPRIAQAQLVHRPLDHLDQMRRDILLHIEAAQRRAPLPRRAERPRHDIAHRLLRQGRAIDDHRVKAACLRDQRRADRQMIGHGGANPHRGRGGAGEDHARNTRI